MYARISTRVYIRSSYPQLIHILPALAAYEPRIFTRVHIRAYIYARTRGVQRIELFTLIHLMLRRDSQSAWSLTRRHWQRVVTLAQKHTADIFLYSGWK